MNTQEKIYQHIEQEYPKEACGVIIIFKGKERVYPCKNVALKPYENFEINPEDYQAASQMGDIIRVYHSHPNASAEASMVDMKACNALGVPWSIISWPSKEETELLPNNIVEPLIGRQFVHGVLDCYTLVKDYYERELNIHLVNRHRKDNWWYEGENLYLDNYEKDGFQYLGDSTFKDLRKYDALLMMLESPVPNHAAIYLGDGRILHHVYGRLSCRDIYGGYWKKITTHVLRHNSLC